MDVNSVVACHGHEIVPPTTVAPTPTIAYAAIPRGRVALQWNDVFVDRIENIGGLGEDRVLDFVGRRDPIAGTHDNLRGIELVERSTS